MGEPGWRILLGERGSELLSWLDDKQALLGALAPLSEGLSDYLIESCAEEQAAQRFVNAVPDIMSKCNDPATYELPFAPEAYAWVHLLDRYVRTWEALALMVSRGCLPMGKHGISVLEVGTGPGPAGMAIRDFYAQMTAWAAETGHDRFRQPTFITCYERSEQWNAFRHRFGEYLLDYLDLIHARPDFMSFDPARDRDAYRRRLRDEEYFDETTGTWEAEYTATEINDEVQRHERYRLLVFSNVLTTKDITKGFEEALRDGFEDLRPGAQVMVLGYDYPAIYSFLDKLAAECGLTVHLADERVSASRSDAQETIRLAGTRVYAHLSALVDTSELPQRIRDSFGDSVPWRSESRLRVYSAE